MESRPLGATENSLCRALPGGTGVVVIALLVTKQPDLQLIQNALHKLQNCHPILRSKLHFDPIANKFSFVTPANSALRLKSTDLRSTKTIVQTGTGSISPFQTIVEHELNLNPWENPRPALDIDLFQAKVYEMEGEKWTVAMKVHGAACDRAAGDVLLREVVMLLSKGEGAESEIMRKGEVKMGIEEYMPGGKHKKSLWGRGLNVLRYSLIASQASNIKFKDTRSTRRTQLARLRLEPEVTARLLKVCRRKEIDVCGALTAAALMGAPRSKSVSRVQCEKYSVVTFINCRPLLDPPLATHDIGFYSAGILNTYDINGKEQLWDLAKRTHDSVNAAKSANKHFSEMADLTFLSCKAIENPRLTPSTSLRASFLSVFEDVIVSLHVTLGDPDYKDLGVEDYAVTSSVHGLGSSLALLATIRDGGLDCVCVYPSPLHSRDQVQGLLNDMKTMLTEASYS